ncbi:hypothetical protein JOM56_010112 [Amanita muscaria]
MRLVIICLMSFLLVPALGAPRQFHPPPPPPYEEFPPLHPTPPPSYQDAVGRESPPPYSLPPISRPRSRGENGFGGRSSRRRR